MKSILAACALALSLLFSALPAVAQQETADYQTMPIEELIALAPEVHPAALYILSARLLGQGDGYAAAQWMYAGQIRYRLLIEADGNPDDRVLFSALSESVGRPVNEYIAGNVDEWIAVMEWALAWDEATPNLVTAHADHAAEWAEWAEIRAGLESLIADVDARRDEIPVQREQNGLKNR